MTDIVRAVVPLGRPPWPTLDPFLFCVHHVDKYPAGNEKLGPAASLDGRRIGMDFDNRDGWNMYHGDVVPGFPMHPHRGFETITIVREGLIDHSDSMGAKARFGDGDVQWMTAGGGVVHSEMFPLLDQDGPNHTEFFQIWLNLPRASKQVPPHFTMFWDRDVPKTEVVSDNGAKTTFTVVAGSVDGLEPPPPPPDSWASNADADVAIWTLRMEPGATFELPAAASPDANRVLYFFAGDTVTVAGREVGKGNGVQLDPSAPAEIVNGSEPAALLMLQGRPIGEPVVQHGPFVMNTQGEIRQTMLDYQRTQFGGWPFGRHDPTHGTDPQKFAVHGDGRRETP